MSERYPPPSYACTVWTNGNAICVDFPGQHTVFIPLDRCGIETNDSGGTLPTQRGWETLLGVLMARHIAEPGKLTIGHKTAPVQYDIEGMMKHMNRLDEAKAATAEELAQAESLLKELDLL